MRNSPLTPWQTPTDATWSIDALPRARVWLLFFVFLIPLVAIAGRLYWLQVVIPDRFLATWSKTTESFESLPVSDGRILSSDGQVLAFDQRRYEIQVHYRWLEEPVNADWLTARAKEKLPRSDRQNKTLVAAAKTDLLTARTELWQNLTVVTGRSSDELTALRAAIQRRIETMRESVANHRTETQTPPPAVSSLAWWERVRHELTTSPDRTSTASMILKEELSPHRLIGDVPVDQIAVIEAQPSRYPGVEIRETSHRVYPLNDVAVHVIGLRTALREDQWAQRKARYPQGDPLALAVGDRVGQTGIERTYDHLLRGSRGLKRIVRDHAGQIVEQEVVRVSRSGKDLTLTIDAALQKQTEAALDESLAATSTASTAAGGVVVIDLRQGEILTAASAPRVGLSDQQHPTKADWKTWSTNPGRPFVSRVTQATIPPGSIFQVVTAIAALETGQCSPDELFTCQGYLNDPDHDRCVLYTRQRIGHGAITLADAVARSCNVYFFQAADRLGPQPIGDWATKLGFGIPTGIDLMDEHAGQLPTRSGPGRAERWYAGTTRQFAIGQADLTATPLQVARLMAIIGNNGHAVTPRLTPADRSLEFPESEIVQASAESAPASRGPRLLSDRTLQTIHQGLELTVSHPQGTGAAAQFPGLLIAAKTGTAEVGQDRVPHAWCAGYVPADKPRYAFAVYLEHGGSEEAAAKLARRVLMSLVEAELLDAESSPAP